jgi:hypothetical protein
MYPTLLDSKETSPPSLCDLLSLLETPGDIASGPSGPGNEG